MDKILRISSGVTEGGRFAERTWDEADAETIPAPPAPIALASKFTPYDNDHLVDTPYPKTMPEPVLGIELDNGPHRLTVAVGDETFSFWEDNDGYAADDTLNQGEGRFASCHQDVDASIEQEEFVDWGNAMFANVGANIHAATQSAISEDVKQQLINVALNK
jgi:hypothetical protein